MPRLLLLLFCLLFASRTSFAQPASTETSKDEPDGCPVTMQHQANPFVPPKPYSQQAPNGSFWFGTEKLWTALPIDGAWRGLGHYTANDPTFRQKLFLWRQGYDWHREPRPNLKVIGKRLDAETDPLFVDRPTNVSSDPGGMLVGINFPTVGCWEITGRYGDDTLTFVIWVTAGRASCDPPSTRMPPTHPVYAEAMELAQTLNRHGVGVQCILLAKMEHMFEDQVGAAFFRTDAGDFEAFFLPRSERWDALEIVEQREPDGYEYDFPGTPRFLSHWEGRRTYFVKYGNQLLNSLEKQTVTKLDAALQSE
ncbi:MAG: hypothetical protein WAM04_23430 [Candidatus Sulfotelmatobacter sp.]